MDCKKAPKKHQNLDAWLKIAFSQNTPEAFLSLLLGIEKDKKLSIGRLRPWAWWVEAVRGCNLRCGFCATRLFPRGKLNFMSIDTWASIIDIIRVVSPMVRLELGMAGEPTLHPQLLEMFRHARRECPGIQLMMYTNGTTLINKRATYRELFEAGLNMVFVDMYSPEEKHRELATKSGYPWFIQGHRPDSIPNIFSYQNNPDLHIIQLSRQPGQWPKKKVSLGKFSTYFNHLDWPAATPYGLTPVTIPPNRRCDLPSKFPSICWDGAYSFCCFDFMREVAGTIGDVSDGVNGFFRFWLGEYMQDTRRRLYLKDRASHPMCSRCAFTSIRCDIPWWGGELLDYWWSGNEWMAFSGPTVTELEVQMISSPGLGLPLPKIKGKRKYK